MSKDKITSPFPRDETSITEASQVLANAFQEDAGTIYMLPNAGQRKKALPVLFKVMLRHGLSVGKVLATGDPIKAVSIWLPALAASPNEKNMADAGIEEIIPYFGEVGMSRLGNLVSYLESMHARLVKQPHERLFFLGVETNFQGQGIGSGLIQPYLEKLAMQQVPCYLDTLEEKNVSFYQRHGFHVLEKSYLPGADIAVWAMLKEQVFLKN